MNLDGCFLFFGPFNLFAYVQLFKSLNFFKVQLQLCQLQVHMQINFQQKIKPNSKACLISL